MEPEEQTTEISCNKYAIVCCGGVIFVWFTIILYK